MGRLLLAAVAASAFAAPVVAAGSAKYMYSAERFKVVCAQHPVWCQGYIAGVISNDQAMAYSVDKDGKPENSYICLRPGHTPEQLRLITMKYIADNPDKLDWPAPFVVHNAIVDAFPCKPAS